MKIIDHDVVARNARPASGTLRRSRRSNHATQLAKTLRAQILIPTELARLLGLVPIARKGGRACTILCPFHADTHPSCSVFVGNDTTIHFKCFSCGAHGDALGLIARVLHYDQSEFPLLLEAAQYFAAEIESLALNQLPEMESSAPPQALGDAAYDALFRCLVEQGPVDTADEVAAYLDNRGILAEAVADGWAAFPAPAEQKKFFDAVAAVVGHDLLVSAGLTVADGDIRQPEHRLVIPWRDPAGRCTTTQRRLLRANRTKEPKYVSPPGRAIMWPYGVDALSAKPRANLAIVEGAIDVLSLRALCRKHGIDRAVIGIPGVSSWRPAWAALARGRTVYVALDGDAAGEAAVAQIVRDCTSAGALTVCRSVPRAGKDWNDLLVGGAS